MTVRVSLDKSLVIRYGNATYQLNRVLRDGGSSVQFENQRTGQFKEFELSKFYSMLQSKQLTVVQGETAEKEGDPPNKADVILDLSSLPEKEREQVGLRISLIRQIQKLGLSRGQRREISRVIEKNFSTGKWEKVWQKKKPPSTSAVMKWMRDYELSGGNAASLVSGNHCRKRRRSISEAVEGAMEWVLKTFYLKRGRLSLTYAYERLCERLKQMAKHGEIADEETKISMATFQRRKDELDPHMVLTKRYGSDYAHQKLRYTVTGTTTPRAMARLEVDHTLLNWVVICDRTGIPLGRPTLTIIVDSYSGYIVGLYVSFNGPGLTTVINVIKNGIAPKNHLAIAAGAKNPWLAWGIGDCYLLDNGMEFHAHVLRYIAWELACDLEYCRVRFPWLKPKVERTFLDLDYLSLTEGRVYKPDPNIINIDPKKDASIALSLLCKGLIKFAVDEHASQVNKRTLETHFDRFMESLEMNPLPELPNTMKGLDLAAAMSKTMVVSNGGVELLGLNYAGYELKELLHSAGGKFRTLVKWNPDDLGAVFVQHSRTKEWVTLFCTRSDYAQGLSWNQHRLLRSYTRKHLHQSGTVDRFLTARQEMHELWINPMVRKNKGLDFESAKRYSQLSATTSTFHGDVPSCPPRAAATVAPEEMTYESSEVPDFDAVTF